MASVVCARGTKRMALCRCSPLYHFAKDFKVLLTSLVGQDSSDDAT